MRGLLQIPPRYGGLLGDVELPLVDPRLAVNEKAPPRAPGMVMAPVAGMTGTRAPSAVQRLFRGLGNGVGNVLAGADDPSLSAEQNAKARNAAIIRAGLAMMAAGGQGQSLGEVLAGGAMAGQEAGAQSRAGTSQRAMQARMSEIVASGAGVDELRRMFQQSVLSGDQQAMQAIATALQAAEATERERFSSTAAPAPSVIREGGRDFPNTEEGAAAALAWARARAEATRIPGSGAAAGRPYDPNTDVVLQREIARRERGLVNTPNRTATAETALASLENYRDLVTEYMNKSSVERAGAMFGRGDQGAVGEIEAAQRALLLDVKTLADLGALAGPDVEIVTEMIGDPTTWGATLRDKDYTLSRLAEAQKYLERKLATADAAERRSSGAPAQPVSWQDRANQLKAAGKSQTEIVATLRAEGLIE